MTALNFAFDRQRCLIACDSAVTGSALEQETSKVLALPHLRMLIGMTGHLAISLHWAFSVLWNGAIVSVADANQVAPDELRRLRDSLNAREPTSVTHFGLVDGEIRVYEFHSARNFEQREVAPGSYFHPDLRAGHYAAAPGARELTLMDPSEPHDELPPASWAAQCQGAVAAIPHQRRLTALKIGGTIQCSLLTPDAIHQHWM